MADRRRKDSLWFVANEQGQCMGVEHAQLAVLMDLRDELKQLNELLHCYKFRSLPDAIGRIDRRLARAGFRLLNQRRRGKQRQRRKGAYEVDSADDED